MTAVYGHESDTPSHTMPHVTDLIFDFDGTLVDSAPAILESFAHVLAEAGIQPQTPLERSLIGPPLMATLAKLAGTENPEVLDRLTHAFKAHYDAIAAERTPAYPGTADCLQQLKATGFRLHIATNKRATPTHAILKKLSWSALFASVYCIDSKPPAYSSKAALLTKQIPEENIATDQAIYIGDTVGDLTAATEVNLAFLGVAWGYHIWPPAPHIFASWPLLTAFLRSQKCQNLITQPGQPHA